MLSPCPVHSFKIIFFQRIAIIIFSFRMPPLGPEFFSCILCNKRTKPGERRRVCHSLSRVLANTFLVGPKSGDVICDKCRRRHYRQKEQNTSKIVNFTESCELDYDYTPPTSKPRRDNNILYTKVDH